MKKNTLSFLLLIASFLVEAQSHLGFLTDNYRGVHGVISNPANIADSPFKIDVNLTGISAFGDNDYYGIDVFEATKKGYDFGVDASTYSKEVNYASLNVDFFGPSFMFNINKNSSLALFTRTRAFVNVNEVSGASIASVEDNITEDYSFEEDNANFLGHSWAELGITYASVILDKEQHFLKGGVSLKYLQGLGSAFIIAKDLFIDYDADGTNLGGETIGSITSRGNLTYARFAEFDNDDYDYEVPKKSSGLGVDFGFVYEWRPHHANYKIKDSSACGFDYKEKYKLKIGVSFTDIGFINYKEGIKEAYNINQTDLNEEEFDAADDAGAFFNTFYTRTNTVTGYKVDLPTALHVNVDLNFNSKVYLNLNTDLSLMSQNRITANRISNIVSLTPRYESRQFSFYMPLSVIGNSGFRMGAGLRAGPLYLGSGSLISAFVSDNNTEADVYAGLKIPIYKKASKDKDGDGVCDKLDDCPKIAGSILNNGCPIEDQDNDGVLDDVDTCPEIAGPEENNGCPWGDKDEDGILDNEDACPEEAGFLENKGCPWKDHDGDGVLDKDDDCVNEAGSVVNNGCPEEVIQKIQNSLNDFAKVILFNSGTSVLKAESSSALSDIIAVLKEYPNAKIVIEGHTDSIGSYDSNQKLSETRAQAVKDYLVEKGIDSIRLSAIGYGERKPVATNMYKAGRAQNRRVEIKLVK